MRIETLLDTTAFFYGLSYLGSLFLLQVSYRKRLFLSRALAADMLLVPLLMGFMICTDGAVGLRFCLGMLVILLCFFSLVSLLFSFSWEERVFQAVKAFLLGELGGAFGWLILFQMGEGFGPWAQLGFLLLFYTLFFGFFCFLEGWLGFSAEGLSLTWKEAGVTVLWLITTYVTSNLGFLDLGEVFRGRLQVDIYLSRMLCDLSGVAVVYAFAMGIKETALARERDALQAVNEMQYRAYQISRESMDTVNQKYHDLKHHLSLLREGAESPLVRGELTRMEEEVRGFECVTHTGHEVLDAILTMKRQACEKRGIALKLMVDGESLSFMDKIDLSALFGNLLDNAIECCCLEEGYPVIRLNVSPAGQFVCIYEENTCSHPVAMREGLPETTKGDRFLHGYGVKSMKKTAQAYGGSLLTEWSEGVFRVKILLDPASRP